MRTVTALSAAGLTGVAGFQIALAAGAPWAHLAWGGAGGARVLPSPLRVASAVSAGLWLAAAGLVMTGNKCATRRIAGLLVVGSAMNAASPSPAEARLWAPTSLALAGLTTAAARSQPWSAGVKVRRGASPAARRVGQQRGRGERGNARTTASG